MLGRHGNCAMRAICVTCCISMMARWGLAMAHSSLACSRGAPGTPCATASSAAVFAASKWPAEGQNQTKVTL